MKSVGEVMAFGRNFQESFQKALRGLEIGCTGLDETVNDLPLVDDEDDLKIELKFPGAERIWHLANSIRKGLSLEEVNRITGIDPWFLYQIADLIFEESNLKNQKLEDVNKKALINLKKKGFSDARIAHILNIKESDVRIYRYKQNVRPTYKRVDTCAAEFQTDTAYMYSSYDEECEARPNDTDKVIILGGGPNRIGQGIEFDYCCVHASLALKDAGYETIMVNCNPETVSTDYDISDRLFFEPLTFEDVMEIIDIEKPVGVIVQYGGQTPLKLARLLEDAGAPIIGTSPDSIDLAEDRERFQSLINELALKQPPNRTASNKEEALRMSDDVGFPLVVRPSYVLGGRAMEIVHNKNDLSEYMSMAVKVSNDSPVLLDRFLDLAIEVDVDIICDGEDILIGGIMEHIEQAGVHSGDSGCSLPPFSLNESTQKILIEQVTKLAHGLNVIGLMNTQFAIQGDDVYILEVNPRASRTIPFVSKATGIPLAKIAAEVMVGKKLKDMGYPKYSFPSYFSVKEAVFPFIKFPGADPILGPEMKSTGEVMGTGRSFGEAYAKAQLASNVILPVKGTALMSVRDRDKKDVIELAKILISRGFQLIATNGTAKTLSDKNIDCERVNKVREGRPHIVDMIKNDEIDLIVNTTEGKRAILESASIRAEAVKRNTTYYTTIGAAIATCEAIEHINDSDVNRLKDLHKEQHNE
tara:strand:- start:1447 stop:3543 length:2097 start_codon:yes stop_codon:yes gene_type:complete